MKVTKFNSDKIVTIPVHKYKFDSQKKVSKGQKIIQDFILRYIPQNYILQECRVPGSLLRIDLFLLSKRAIIEYSPKSHHGTFNPFFHNNRLGLLKSIKNDMAKYDWAAKNELKWVELAEGDVDNLSYDFFVDKFGLYL